MEDNKLNITYLLGAGASAFAVPTIKYFNVLLEEFRNQLELKVEEYSGNYSDFDLETLKSKIKLIDDISSFATIDTWARKLYLSNSDNYNGLKELISLFLVFCQFGSNTTISNFFSNESKMIRHNLNFTDVEKNQFNRMYQTPLDPRYDLFLGSLLKKNEKNIVSFPNNISIISWNYDSQFETSLKTFSNSKILDDFGNPINHIKINGNANFDIFSGGRSENAFNFYNKVHLNLNYWPRVIDILSGKFSNFQKFANQLKFAWELDNDIIVRVNSLLKSTDILVVIGYSFPSFNQEVEKKMFFNISRIKKVYYQVPANEYKGLFERITGTMSINGIFPKYWDVAGDGTGIIEKDVKFENIEDIKQFYIPNEFYSNIEGFYQAF